MFSLLLVECSSKNLQRLKLCEEWHFPQGFKNSTFTELEGNRTDYFVIHVSVYFSLDQAKITVTVCVSTLHGLHLINKCDTKLTIKLMLQLPP